MYLKSFYALVICVPYNLLFFLLYFWSNEPKLAPVRCKLKVCFFFVVLPSLFLLCLSCFPYGWPALDTSANQSLFSLRPVHWLVTTHKGALHLGTWLCPRTSLIADRQVGLLLPEPISSPCLLPFYPVLYCYGWESGPERIEYCFPSHHSCVWMLRMQAI